jgi:hypothetical protein
MWCSNCQQETPGQVHPATGRTVCSRCQQPSPRSKSSQTARISDDGLALDEIRRPTATAAASSTEKAAPPFRTDDWAARQRVRNAVRELRRPTPVVAGADHVSSDARRWDPPLDLFGGNVPGAEPMVAPPSPLGSSILPQSSAGSSQFVAWLTVILGSLALVGGISLIAWSFSAHAAQFWNLGLALALGGQGALILGLVLVISRLWRNSRYATTKLHEVNARLGQLQQTSETIAASRAPGAPAFYADLVRGASPHVLLANLRGQVDQLATRVGGY